MRKFLILFAAAVFGGLSLTACDQYNEPAPQQSSFVAQARDSVVQRPNHSNSSLVARGDKIRIVSFSPRNSWGMQTHPTVEERLISFVNSGRHDIVKVNTMRDSQGKMIGAEIYYRIHR